MAGTTASRSALEARLLQPSEVPAELRQIEGDGGPHAWSLWCGGSPPVAAVEATGVVYRHDRAPGVVDVVANRLLRFTTAGEARRFVDWVAASDRCSSGEALLPGGITVTGTVHFDRWHLGGDASVVGLLEGQVRFADGRTKPGRTSRAVVASGDLVAITTEANLGFGVEPGLRSRLLARTTEQATGR